MRHATWDLGPALGGHRENKDLNCIELYLSATEIFSGIFLHSYLDGTGTQGTSIRYHYNSIFLAHASAFIYRARIVRVSIRHAQSKSHHVCITVPWYLYRIPYNHTVLQYNMYLVCTGAIPVI